MYLSDYYTARMASFQARYLIDLSHSYRSFSSHGMRLVQFLILNVETGVRSQKPGQLKKSVPLLIELGIFLIKIGCAKLEVQSVCAIQSYSLGMQNSTNGFYYTKDTVSTISISIYNASNAILTRNPLTKTVHHLPAFTKAHKPAAFPYT